MNLCNWLFSLLAVIWTFLTNIGSSNENIGTKSLSDDPPPPSIGSSFLPTRDKSTFPILSIEEDDPFNAFPILIALIDRSYFYGEWMDIQGNIIPKFSNERGFTIFHYDSLANFKIDLHLYDGEYVDGNAMTIMYNHTDDIPSHFNQSNA